VKTAVYLFLLYFTLTFAANLLYFRSRSRSVRGGGGQGDEEKVTVLIPVRNEESNLGPCLDSLLAQSYRNLEIIVMDDHSRDSSWEIISRYAEAHPGRIRGYRSQALPDGWSGKNWVCHQMSLVADGAWLVFTDADTVHGVHSVRHALAESRARGAAMVSYLPELVTVSLAEKVVLPVIYFAFYFFIPHALIRRIPNRNAAVAIGTFILVSRRMYDRVGGHNALRDEIVEDMSLARAVKGAGGGVDILSGTGLLGTRFYHNAAEIWNGFSKNAFGAFGYSVLPFLATLVICYAVFLDPFVRLAMSPELSFHNPFFNQALAIILLRLGLALRTRHSLVSILLHPVMVGFSLGFAGNSIWKILRRAPIEWKGREYRITK
jgi:chlorobactene glucosyltransferase